MELLADQKKRSLVGQSFRHDMVVHNAVCNEHRTTDGVINGGERLVQEMLETIRSTLLTKNTTTTAASSSSSSTMPQQHDVTVSIVGNSLGGIYGRYAISRLQNECSRSVGLSDDNNGRPQEEEKHEQRPNDNDNVIILDGKYRIHFNVFCTTASPHLGLSKHTYLRLPRSAEIGLAHTMGITGKDL